jgi:hypothetical protein
MDSNVAEGYCYEARICMDSVHSLENKSWIEELRGSAY